MADNKYVQELKELQKNKAVQALMYVIPWAEGSVDKNTSRERGYYRLFGFNKDGSGRFMDSLDFVPDSPGYYRDPVTGQIKQSHDYGLYQLNKMNIPRLQKKIGRTDFSPETQDLMFLALLDEQPGFRKRIQKGNVNDWTAKDYQELYGIAGHVYNSLPNGPGSGAKRTVDFLMNKTNEFLQGQGSKPIAYSSSGQTIRSNATGNAGLSRSSAEQIQPYSFAQEAINSNPNYQGSFFLNAMNDIMNKSYANTGNIPFEVVNSNIGNRIVFGAIDEDPQALVNKLFDTDPNTTYGLSYVGSSLRPTVSRLNPEGNRVNMIEFPNGNYINAATGERMNPNGTVWVDPEVPQEEVVLVDDLNDPHPTLETTAEAALPSGSTPPTTGNAASPVAYVNPNDVRVRAVLADTIGGDLVTRTMNGSREDVLGLGGDVIDLA